MLLLQNSCNDATNNLEQKKEKKSYKTVLYGKIKDRRERERVNG